MAPNLHSVQKAAIYRSRKCNTKPTNHLAHTPLWKETWLTPTSLPRQSSRPARRSSHLASAACLQGGGLAASHLHPLRNAPPFSGRVTEPSVHGTVKLPGKCTRIFAAVSWGGFNSCLISKVLWARLTIFTEFPVQRGKI